MNYLRHIDRQQIQMDFLVFSPPDHYDAEAEELGCNIYRLPSRRENPLKNYRQIDDFFDDHSEYDIVHIHQGITYFKPLQSAYKHKIPVRIVHSHGLDIRFREKYRLFYHYYAVPHICKLATHYVACSENAAQQLFLPTILEKKQYYLMKNAIETGDYCFSSERRSELRAKLSIENKFVIGHVGRFDYAKNHDFIIEVFKEVIRQNREAHLILIGTGENCQTIMEKAQAYGLKDHIDFLGVCRDVADLLQAMDVFLLPSRFEGLPCVGIEAQAAGLPCVFSDAVTREVQITSTCSFLSLGDEISTWAKTILSYTRTPRENTREKIVHAGYDIQTEARNLEQFYRECREISQ